MALPHCQLLRLEQIALRNLVVLLWNSIDVLSEIDIYDRLEYLRFKTLLQNWVRLLTEKAQLFVPITLLTDVRVLIEPIGSEILGWIRYHLDFLRHPHSIFQAGISHQDLYRGFNRNILQNLSWTSAGSINYQKTAQELIRAEILTALPLYKMACLYCLENYVLDLSEKLPDIMKHQFCNKRHIVHNAQLQVDAFWYDIVWSDSFAIATHGTSYENIPNFYHRALEIAAYTGNKAATEYFYKKLTDAEKEDLLLQTAKAVASKDFFLLDISRCELEGKEYDVLCYFLSQMNPPQQLEFFRAHAYDILKSLVVWRWRDLFMKVAELMWDFLPDTDYYRLLVYLESTDVISKDLKVDLFKKYFSLSPKDFKNHFIEECLRGYFFYDLFRHGNLEIIRFLFSKMDAATTARLAFCDQGWQIFIHLIQDGKWRLMKQLIDYSVLSEENRMKLRRYWKLYISKYCEEGESKILQWESI